MLIDAGGFRCNVIDEGSGRPIVWLHGLGGTWREFELQLDHLADTYRCIVPELRGHGRTPAVPGPMSTTDLAGDVRAVLDALGVSRTVVVGLSMGGLVAQALAVTHPDVVEALVLVGTGPRVPAPVGMLLRAAAARVRSKGMSAALQMLQQTGSGAGGDEDAMRQARADGTAWQQRELASNDPDVLAAGLVALAGHDCRKRLRSLDVPTLVMSGADDPVVPVSLSQELAKLIPGARFVVLPDAGHIANRDQPEAFEAALTEFVDGLVPA